MKKLVLALCILFVCGIIGCENKPQLKPQPQSIQSKVDPKDEEFMAFEPTDITRIIERQMMRDELKKRHEAIKAKYEKK